eukprot:gnl/TRDRNA2_/TRDRNA2_173942_c3_seq2.p1 gnl/TRDRNA2_/TRDRNA2_173942_c3~~gnl/TRDRNA2_/TRDRNA2_173942_c3_seq2.p1  ORF type:complete len:345 (-),score=54.37 gnl/TRDRNA2_/TRDRNA2_173942_c3_seq2:137-1075(-)
MRVQRDAAQGHATSRTAADDVWGARVQSPTYSRASSTLSTRAESEEGYFSFTEDFVVQSPEKNIEAPSPLAIASPEAARSPSRMIRWSDASCEPPNADFVTDFVTATVRRLSCQRSPAELPMKPGPVSRPPALKPGPVVVPPLLSEGQDSASLSEQSANKTMPIARTGAAARRRMQRRHGVAVAARAAVWAKLVGPMMAKAKAAEATALETATAPIRTLLAERRSCATQAECVRALYLPARKGSASEPPTPAANSPEWSESSTCVLVVTSDGRLDAFEVPDSAAISTSRYRSASSPPGHPGVRHRCYVQIQH